MVRSLSLFPFVSLVYFSFIYVRVDGDRLRHTEDFHKPSQHRKLHEYNCPKLYSVNDTEIERIQSELKGFEQKYDIVVLNFSVSLDCIIDDEMKYDDMKYVRHFLVTTKGKTILKYSVEAEYFSLKVFGFKSTILNVNVTPMHVNDSANVEKTYALPNFTEISKRLLTKSGFTDVCLGLRNEHMWFLTFLFIPKGAIFNKNGLICHQTDGRQNELKTSALVYSIYVVCFFATMHVNLCFDLMLEEIDERRGDRERYHKDATPFSITRLMSNVYKVLLFQRDKNVQSSISPIGDSESTGILLCVEISMFFWSIPTAIGYYLLTQLNAWDEHVIFLNDGTTLNYIINTYVSPATKGDWFTLSHRQACTIFGIAFYAYLLLYLRFAFIFTKSLDRNGVAFTTFQPAHVFSHAIEQSKYCRIDRGKKSLSLSSNFVRSYEELFNCAFWAEIIRVSISIPRSVSMKYAKKISSGSGIHCCPLFLCRLFLGIFALLERCLYIVFAVVNICVNVSFIILQTIFPILKYFCTGYVQRVNKKWESLTGVVSRYTYAIGMFLLYTIIWCGANLFVFNSFMVICSYFLYLTILAIPFNPSYGVAFLVIVLSLVSYLLMFYDDFQSEYKHLLDTIFEILDEHFVKKLPITDVSLNDCFDLKTSIKVRQIDAAIFDQLYKKYIPLSRKCAYLFIKLAFTITFIVIAFNALGEFGTGIETLKVSDFFSVILLVMIPGIIRNFNGQRQNLRRSQLYFKVFKYLKRLDKKNKLESMVKLDIDESSSDSEEEEDNGVLNNEPRDPITDINNA